MWQVVGSEEVILCSQFVNRFIKDVGACSECLETGASLSVRRTNRGGALEGLLPTKRGSWSEILQQVRGVWERLPDALPWEQALEACPPLGEGHARELRLLLKLYKERIGIRTSTSVLLTICCTVQSAMTQFYSLSNKKTRAVASSGSSCVLVFNQSCQFPVVNI